MSERDTALRAKLEQVRSVLQHPDNGWHYCRWCGQQTTGPNGAHASGCGYVYQCQQIDEAKATLAALLAEAERPAVDRCRQCGKSRRAHCDFDEPGLDHPDTCEKMHHEFKPGRPPSPAPSAVEPDR